MRIALPVCPRGKMRADCLKANDKKKARYFIGSGLSFIVLGWLMGLEPTTTGITILIFIYLHPLIDVGTLYINQHITGYFLDK